MKMQCTLEIPRYIKTNFQTFAKKGGKFIQTNITSIEQTTLNEIKIKSESEEYRFEKSVIASGAFSKS